MKIIFIAAKAIPFIGGVEKYTEEIGMRLAQKGHEVIVYTMKYNNSFEGNYKGIKIIPLPTIKMRALDKLFIMRYAVFKVLFEKNVDIVHFHGFQNSSYSFLLKFFKCKVIMQGHGLEWQRSRWTFIGRNYLKYYEKLILNFPKIFFHKATVVSNYQHDYYKQKYNVDTIVIPTGVSEPQFEKNDIITQKYGLEGNDYILFLARLVREKGAHHLINAYNTINTNIKLVIAGDAAHEEKYKQELKNLSIHNPNIIYTGFVSGKELRELYTNALFYVLPSEIEGLPISLLEAMSYNNCCLSSDIPPNLEATENGKYGYHFKSEDIVDLAKKLNELINNKENIKIMQKKANEHVMNNYTWDKITVQFEQLYSDVINHKI